MSEYQLYQADLIVIQHDEEAIASQGLMRWSTNVVADIASNRTADLGGGDNRRARLINYLDSIVRKLSLCPASEYWCMFRQDSSVGEPLLQDNADLLERAVRAGVVVNTIDARGLYTPQGLPEIDSAPHKAPFKHRDANANLVDDSKIDYQGIEGTYRMQAQFESGQVLQGMAAGTGGTYFHNRNDLDVGHASGLGGAEHCLHPWFQTTRTPKRTGNSTT